MDKGPTMLPAEGAIAAAASAGGAESAAGVAVDAVVAGASAGAAAASSAAGEEESSMAMVLSSTLRDAALFWRVCIQARREAVMGRSATSGLAVVSFERAISRTVSTFCGLASDDPIT